jgi:hypothetical protein
MGVDTTRPKRLWLWATVQRRRMKMCCRDCWCWVADVSKSRVCRLQDYMERPVWAGQGTLLVICVLAHEYIALGRGRRHARARKISCRRRNMVKFKVQWSWIYASAQKTGSRQASRDHPSKPANQACHVARLEPTASSSEGRVWIA